MSSSSALVENTIRRHLAKHEIWQHLAQDSPEIQGAVEHALLARGKRLRPRLFMLTAAGYGMQSEQITQQVSLALELAHAFVLLHDDLIDKASSRRGIPTIGRELDARWSAAPARSFTGNDAALILGDLLYTLAIEALLQTGAAAEKGAAAVRMLAGAAQMTARGALREIVAARTDPAQLSMAQLYQTYRLKTAFYTFQLPMQLGALFADRADTSMAAIQAFAGEAGLAFQLCNDYKPLQAWLTGGELPDDIREGRVTAALLHVWENTTATERNSLMGGNSQTVHRLFLDCDVLDWLAREIEHLIAQAKALIAPLGLSQSAAASLHQLLDTMPCSVVEDKTAPGA